MTFAFDTDTEAAEFAARFDTPDKAKRLAAGLKFRKEGADYFGVCPHCYKTDGYVNAGKTHVFYCKAHKVSWIAGANLFSSWQMETEEEQRRTYVEEGVDQTQRIEPFHWPLTVEQWREREAAE